DQDTDFIWERVGGHPQNIWVAASDLDFVYGSGILDEQLSFSHARIFDALDFAARSLWSVLAMHPPHVYTIVDVSPGKWINARPLDWIMLAKHQVVEVMTNIPTGIGYHLTNAARNFIESNYQYNPSVKDTVDRVLTDLLNIPDDLSLNVVETILSARWFALT